MDMPREENLIEPIARITDERLKHAVTILQSAQYELSPAKERLEELAQNLARLLDEIEQFETIVYCGKAAACLVGYKVLRVLAGSIMWEGGKWRVPWKKTKICKDAFWHASSAAAEAALKRSSARGPEEWKDRAGRSINAIHEKKADEAKKANDRGSP